MFDVVFSERGSLESRPLNVGGIRWEVEELTWRAVGGPWSGRLAARPATAQAEGTAQGQALLWALTNLLRCGVEVRDQGQPAWWGYVSAVSIVSRGYATRISLDEMSNRVAVVYNQLSPNPYTGPLTWSSWVEDGDSIFEYGRKVGVYNIASATPTDAERAAAGKLAANGKPLATLSTDFENGLNGLRAIVEVRGWWETLSWEYYTDLLGWEGNAQSGAAQNIGSALGNSQAAQSFTVANAWPLVEIWLRARRYRNADNLVVQVTSDAGGAPGGVLATVTVPNGQLSDESTWYKARLAAPLALSAATTYWVVISRSGAISAVDYFVVGVDERRMYGSGVLRLWDGANWVARVPDADLGFVLIGEDETSTLLRRMLSAGQFITGSEVETSSGRQGRIYRDGSRRLREEAELLLRDGNSSGQRYLATVEPDRSVRVYTCPWVYNGSPSLIWIGAGGYLSDRSGRRLPCSTRGWGKWIALGEAAGPGGSPGAGVVFAESVIFDGQGLKLADAETR